MPTYLIRPEGVFAQDTYVSSNNPTTRYGLDDTLKFGFRVGQGFHFAIIELPLRSIRAGATVTFATLTLPVITYPSSSFNAECDRLVRYDWDQATATYDEFKDGAPWTTVGGDIASSTPAKFTFGIPTSGALIVSGPNFVKFIQDALDSRASRLLIRLRGEEGVGKDVVVGSGQNVDVSKAPRLSVTTTEVDLGRPYVGIKRAVSNWARGESAAASVHYMAVGIGDSPDSDYTTRRRLKEEIYRRPIFGATLDSSNRSVDFWASFSGGQGTGTITEIGLFEKDNTTVVDVCNSTSGWSGTDWSFFTSGESWEGTTVTAANLTTTTSNPIEKTLDIDLRKYNLDDYLQLWIQIGDVSALDTLDLILTDDVGTWTWTGLASSLRSNTFVNYMLKFKDAVAAPSASGPSIVSKITFQVGTMQSDNFFLFDYIRVIPNEENILLWAPPPGGTLVKGSSDKKKIFIRLTTKRGTN